MIDFKLSNLFVWENTKKYFIEVFQDKRKVVVLSLILFSSLSVVLIILNQARINQLETVKKKTQLELSVLKQSAAYSKEMDLKENQKLEELEKRVERIISTGEDFNTSSVLGVSEVKNEIEEKSKLLAKQQEVLSSNFTSISTDDKNQNQNKTNSLGNLEVYDSSRKEVYIYKDASTTSVVISTIEVGAIVNYYKKSSGWYLIKSDDNQKDGWVPEKNVRILNSDEQN